MNTLADNPQERREDLLLCIETVGELLDPDRDAPDRDKLSLLLAVLLHELREAQAACDKLKAA